MKTLAVAIAAVAMTFGAGLADAHGSKHPHHAHAHHVHAHHVHKKHEHHHHLGKHCWFKHGHKHCK